MVVAGKTQYLHMVNRIPKGVMEKLTKEIHCFMNEYKKQPRVSQKTLQAPREVGGRNLLDLESQDEVIQLMWLKGYLASDEQHQTWAYLTDDILRLTTRKKDRRLEWNFHNNTFLQTWKVNPQKLPKSGDIKILLVTAEANGVVIERPPYEVAMKMPAWYHRYSITGFQAELFTKPSKCLHFNHSCKTISDLVMFSRRRENMTGEQHTRRPSCRCNQCKSD
jgi:hypothetical protein